MSILSQLERDLFRAADERLPAPADPGGTLTGHGGVPQSQFRRRARSAIAGLPVALAIFATVAVAVVALGAFKHGHGSVRPAGAGGATSPRAELIQAIAVLRRPQVKADLDPQFQYPYFFNARIYKSLPRTALAQWGYPKADRALLRVVTVPSLQAHVLLAPTTYQPSATARQRSEGIGIAVRSPGNYLTGSGPKPTSASSFLTHGLSVFFGAHSGSDAGVLLVPDGIASVTLGPFRPVPLSTPGGVDSSALKAATAAIQATASVHDNLAAFKLTTPLMSSKRSVSAHRGGRSGSALLVLPTTAQATWFDANGHVIRRTTTEVHLLVSVRGAEGHPQTLHGQAIKRTQFCRQNPHAC